MPKPVEAPNPYISPPAANVEDMTQPYGPLEEGDQAVIDAMHRLPERTGLGPDEHLAREADGTITRLARDGTFGQDIVTAHTTKPDGSTESVTAFVDVVPAMDTISVSKHDSYNGAAVDSIDASGNEVGVGHAAETDRAKAQAAKLEVASRIDKMRERIGEAGVEAAQH